MAVTPASFFDLGIFVTLIHFLPLSRLKKDYKPKTNVYITQAVGLVKKT